MKLFSNFNSCCTSSSSAVNPTDTEPNRNRLSSVSSVSNRTPKPRLLLASNGGQARMSFIPSIVGPMENIKEFVGKLKWEELKETSAGYLALEWHANNPGKKLGGDSNLNQLLQEKLLRSTKVEGVDFSAEFYCLLVASPDFESISSSLGRNLHEKIPELKQLWSSDLWQKESDEILTSLHEIKVNLKDNSKVHEQDLDAVWRGLLNFPPKDHSSDLPLYIDLVHLSVLEAKPNMLKYLLENGVKPRNPSEVVRCAVAGAEENGQLTSILLSADVCALEEVDLTGCLKRISIKEDVSLDGLQILLNELPKLKESINSVIIPEFISNPYLFSNKIVIKFIASQRLPGQPIDQENIKKIDAKVAEIEEKLALIFTIDGFDCVPSGNASRRLNFGEKNDMVKQKEQLEYIKEALE